LQLCFGRPNDLPQRLKPLAGEASIGTAKAVP
jgi:hypothetical protein